MVKATIYKFEYTRSRLLLELYIPSVGIAVTTNADTASPTNISRVSPDRYVDGPLPFRKVKETDVPELIVLRLDVFLHMRELLEKDVADLLK